MSGGLMEVIVRLVSTRLLGDPSVDRIPTSCEVLRTVSQKVLTDCYSDILYVFLSVATYGSVTLPPEPVKQIRVTEMKEWGNCMFKIETPWTVTYVLASEDDGKDVVAPWRVKVIL